MTFLETLQQILTIVGSCLTVFGVPFMIYTVYMRNRSADNQKIQHSETSDLLMAQREKIYNDLYDKKFLEIQKQFDSVMTLNQNHVHTLDTKISQTIQSQNDTNVQIAKLETTISLLIKLFPVAASNSNNIVQQ